jgi:hypothetical protein
MFVCLSVDRQIENESCSQTNGVQIECASFWMLPLHFSVETINVDNLDEMSTQKADETFLRQLDAVSKPAVQL